MNSSPITKIAALLVLVLVAGMGVASADIVINKYDHHQNFHAANDKTFVCSCATTTEYYTVENHGDFASMFSFSLEAEMDWVSMQATQAYLQPGETYRIAVDISPPCGLEMDPPYTVYSTSQYGRYAVAHQDVTATVCESLQFNVQLHDPVTLPCTDAAFTLEVTNVAPYTDEYSLSVDDDAVLLSTEYVRLQAGETANIPARARWSCEVSGLQEVQFQATAQSSGSTHEQTRSVRIIDDYEYLLERVNTQSNVCSQETSKQQIAITNIAQTPNTYNLRHRGPSFATLSESVLVLQPGQTKVVDITLNPPVGSQGSYTSTVRAYNEFGGVHKDLSVDYNVNHCYESLVTISPAEMNVCAGWTDTHVRVENRGVSTETFTLIAEGELYSELNRNVFTLRPGEHADAILNISVPDETATRNVELTVRQTPGIDKTISIPVNALSNAACTDFVVDVQKYTVYRDENVLPVLVKNNGIRATNYELSARSSVAVIQEDNLFLAAGEYGVVHVIVPQADQVADGQYVVELTATSDRSTYRKDLHLTIKDKGFFTRMYEQIAFSDAGTTNWCVLFALIFFALAIILAIVALLVQAGNMPGWVMTPAGVHTAKTVLFVLAGLLALVAIVLFVTTDVPRGYEEPFMGSDYSALYHEFGANDIYDLDLSMYFSDPDGDPLTYTHSQPANLRISIEDNVARIRAAGSWSGTAPVVFTATDPHGASVDSPIMTLRAIPQVPVTFWDWIVSYCKAVNFLLLAVVALLLVAILRARPTREVQTRADGKVVPVSQVISPSASVSAREKTQVHGDVVAGDKITYSGREELYVASVNGKKFHPMDSHFVARMPKEKRIVFRTKEEAIRAGYSPSKQVR